MKIIKDFFEKHKATCLLTIVCAISALIHAVNMFNYPYYENDEGTYLAQAWSVLTEGRLAPYTYWYDHAPVGWIFTSLWLLLTKGLFSFGFSGNTARVFMLILHTISAYFLFKIADKLTKSQFAAIIACVIFSLSPLAVHFQRRLLLDNIMTFWILFSLYLILYSGKHLKMLWLSALIFGISVLTKENAIFLLPAFLYAVHLKSFSLHKKFAGIHWFAIAVGVISFYPLYALLKTELFPPGSPLAPSGEFVSLLGTLKSQSARGAGLPFWQAGSDFLVNLEFWFSKDPFLVILSAVAIVFTTLGALLHKGARLIAFLTLSMIAFLASGKLVINFYIVPVIPLLGLCIGFMYDQIIRLLSLSRNSVSKVLQFVALTALVLFYIPLLNEALTRDETGQQLKAVEWIKKNVKSDANIAIDFYSYLDLSESRFPGDPEFKNADWYWKVQLDPEIKYDKLHDDPKNIDYVMLTAEVERHLRTYPRDTLLHNALKNSKIVAQFSPYSNFKLDLTTQKQLYPNGDWVVIFQQDKSDDFLTTAWESYKEKFIDADGKTIDPQSGRVTSESQSYALLRSVWMNDKTTFDKAYDWSKENLYQADKKLFAWWWQGDTGSASDADSDIALALIFASKQFGDAKYLSEARNILDGIWEHQVASIQGLPFLIAGEWANKENEVILNPSYFSPAYYKIFAQVDNTHPWLDLVDTSYYALNVCTKFDNGNLPPEWCAVSKSDLAASIPEGFGDYYGYNAFRIPWRLALDYFWFEEAKAKNYLSTLTSLSKDWEENGKVAASYSHYGDTITDYESLASYGANLGYFMVTKPDQAFEIYEQKVAHLMELETDNYYTQNWAWFGAALYNQALPNLWATKP